MKTPTETPPTAFGQDWSESLRQSPVVPVVVIEDPGLAVPLARALLAGGVRVIEITFRTAAAAESIRLIRRKVPAIRVGAGTLLSPQQVDQAQAAGASFGVAPGCRPSTVRAAHEAGLPFAPGVMTPGEVEAAVELGCRTLKFFPAESAGGVGHLKSLIAPYRHLDIRFLPTGGITAALARGYLALPEVLAVGGSWLAPEGMMRAGEWTAIEQLAREASALRPDA